MLAAFLLTGCSDEETTPKQEEPPPSTASSSCGHAHNDYEHAKPLIDALDRGFCSVEADIFLISGELLVAHELDQTDPTRTLQSLYLDPLRARIMSDGQAHAGDGPLILLIDVKSDSTITYPALHDVLAQYADILTSFEGDQVTNGAVTAIISGGPDRALMEAQTLRYAAMDGGFDDLTDGGASISLIPLVSQSWLTTITQYPSADVPLTDEKRAELEGYVDSAHDQGRLIRFWAGADAEAGWTAQLDAGVDLIGSDDLAGLQAYLGAAQ